jgi:hypothetical protein
VLLIISALAAPILTRSEDFSIYNTEWNGTSRLTERKEIAGNLLPEISLKDTDSETTIVHNSLLNHDVIENKTSIIIIGPSLGFSDSEADYIKEFLLNGGKVLLADDFGTGNDLLAKINSTCRFSSSLLIDLSYEKKPTYGVVFDFTEHPITANVSQILLNYATTLRVGDDAAVLARSSSGSWLDTNLNGRLDESEAKGPLPVLAVERFGEGELILLSDPSIFVNLMYDYLDNSKFNSNLLGYLGDADTVLIDESHRESTGAFASIFFAFDSLSLLQKMGIIVIFGAFLFVIATKFPFKILVKAKNKIFKFIFRSKKESKAPVDEVIDTVLEKHPEWDKAILTKIVKEMLVDGGGVA